MGSVVPGRNPPSIRAILRRGEYLFLMELITGEKPQHHEHMGSAKYQRILCDIIGVNLRGARTIDILLAYTSDMGEVT
ncbi:MAG: hypothetical protein NUV51_07240 [Sulfuricaulis sp.]|nr:hypothetical protein [Sulfuricaulis sp.]